MRKQRSSADLPTPRKFGPDLVGSGASLRNRTQTKTAIAEAAARSRYAMRKVWCTRIQAANRGAIRAPALQLILRKASTDADRWGKLLPTNKLTADIGRPTLIPRSRKTTNRIGQGTIADRQTGEHNRDETDGDNARVAPDAEQSAQGTTGKIQEKQQTRLAIVQVKCRGNGWQQWTANGVQNSGEQENRVQQGQCLRRGTPGVRSHSRFNSAWSGQRVLG